MRIGLWLLMGVLVAGCTGRVAEPLRSAGFDRSTFDTTVRAQDDFYAYVNGSWLTRTAIPGDRSVQGSFTEASDRAEAQLRALAEDLLIQPADLPLPPKDNLPDVDDTPDVALERTYRQQVRDFYRSSISETNANLNGLRPLRDTLREIDEIKSMDALFAFIGSAQPLLMGMPLAIYVDQDNRNATQHTLYLTQSGLGLPDREYYLNDTAEFVAIRRAYAEYARTLLDIAGHRLARSEATDVIALERRLAAIQWSLADSRDPLRTYNAHTANALRALTPQIDWNVLLNAATLPADHTVIVRQPSYVRELGKLFAEVPLETWRLYFQLRLLDSAAPYLSANMVNAHFQFRGVTLQGLSAPEPRWRRALAAMNFAVGEQFGRLYVARHFNSAAQQRVKLMVANITAAFDRNIDTRSWMSAATRVEAHAKLALLKSKTGFPAVWRDYSALYIRPDDYYGNMSRAAHFQYNRDRAKLDAPVDRDEWLLTPQTVNAYYSPSLNEIVLTAAILGPPFFNLDADDAVNYGAIGAVIGHEISHMFDDRGRNFDGLGNLRDWWQPADLAQFKSRAERLTTQYNNFAVLPGLNVNGTLTLSENIADLSGVAVAWRAWVASLAGRTSHSIDGTTGEQRFFIGWAQVWRSKMRDEATRRMVATNPHAPPRLRVLGVLRNFTPFYEAWGVREGDGMYLPSEQRVQIW